VTFTEYLISTFLGCKKCLYCKKALSIQKRMYSCDKTIKLNKNNWTDNKVKIAFSEISISNLPLKQFEYIEEKITQFNYSIDINIP
jgi:hypothetical protein